jgi:hypothetical protein
MKIKPINQKLKPLLNEFLTDPKLQEKFKDEARRLGYNGDDPDKIVVSLFTPAQDGEIGFADPLIEDMFVNFQIRRILKDMNIPDDLDDETMNTLIQACKDQLLEMRAQEQQ